MSSKILVLVATFLIFGFFSPGKVAAAKEYSCDQNTNTCARVPLGQFDSLAECKKSCTNILCDRGFEPACNFTSVCKTYAFAINFVTMLAAILTLVFFLYGTYKYLTAKGAAEDISKAVSVIINAGAGLLIVVIAYSVTRVLLTATGVGTACF